MADKEANKYLSYAEMAIQDKDYADAKKNILMSLNLKTTEKGYKLLAVCEAKLKAAAEQEAREGAEKPQEAQPSGGENTSSQTDSHSPNSHPAADQAEKSKENGEAQERAPADEKPKEAKEDNGVSGTKDEKTKEERKEATDEDVAICEEILKKTNYYEIIGVDKKATEDEIKKQYKKLALRLHPDKNRAPQATEAFKKLAQALACLTNANKRHIYDEHGSEENFRTQYREYFQDEEELDPEDLFDLLFTGSVNRNRRRRRYAQRPEGQAQAPQPVRGKFYALIQLAPFLLMIVFTLVMQLKGTPEPSFSLKMTEKYYLKKSLESLEVDYFVDSTFDEKFNTLQKISEVELEVKKAVAGQLYRECVLVKKNKVRLEEERYQASSQERTNEVDEMIESLDWSPCRKYDELRDAVM